MTALRSLPNLLTGARIALGLGVFAALAYAAGVLPFQSARPGPADRSALLIWSAVAFAVGAITDYFDGWLARKFHAQSVWGAILDPIADKIAVGGVIVGLCALDPQPAIVVAGGLILFRELFVSGLREVGAARGLAFPVTKLAKWKTTVQLVALVGEILAAGIDRTDLRLTADALLWLAAVLTLWTGAEYAMAAVRGLAAARGASNPAKRR
ncbi:MAG: CDP-diacylglycerol--glycerol-3-phosphate 3-phosphatidyltransferase [Caulobacteraceae bacterium]